MIKRLFTLIAFAALSLTSALAQENPMFAPLPEDPELRNGVLPNGLTY